MEAQQASGCEEAGCVWTAGGSVLTLGPTEHLALNPRCAPRALIIWVYLLTFPHPHFRIQF